MYTSELTEQYRSIQEAKQHNKRKKDATRRQRAARFNLFAGPLSYDLVKERASVDHFRSILRDDRVYSLRVGGDIAQPPVFASADAQRAVVPIKVLQPEVASADLCVYVNHV